MPRMVITKAWVLIHASGEVERLNSLKAMQAAFELVESAPDEYSMEQRDILELRAA